jgi:hypothetical protein
MPLKRLLEESRNFDQKAIAVLLEAFDEVVAKLALRSATDRERAAQIIIQLATGQTELDAAELRDHAVSRMQT